MPFDEGLAERIREFVPKATEKRMFGGIGWMERGNLVAGIWKDALIARVPPEETEKALEEAGVKPFDVTGRPMKGWVLVEAEAVAEEPELGAWIERSRKFVKTLPAK
ncbi:MAG TPA: TfoX/Sxy family protein [Candidatus Thermoplasmatota archaeon]|nr:TfoX/Sxy family protein [Candidatus Thermoplasmatota archaeon]